MVLGEVDIEVTPWISYSDQGEPWLAVRVRRRCAVQRRMNVASLSHNGCRFARSTDFYRAREQWGDEILGAIEADIRRNVWDRS